MKNLESKIFKYLKFPKKSKIGNILNFKKSHIHINL